MDCDTVRRLGAGEWGIDPDRIGILGGSAGGTLAAMVALTAGDPRFHSPDEALAGVDDGVSVAVPHRLGYLYEEGGMMSPDGICRTFDIAAKGTVFGSGVGIVVLKRLRDAIADGDDIHAVIKGTATNNDGASAWSNEASVVTPSAP